MNELNVLLVDDEEMEREGLKFLLTKYPRPLNVLEADSSTRALQILKQHRIDILLTDIRMPIMDGSVFCCGL